MSPAVSRRAAVLGMGLAAAPAASRPTADSELEMLAQLVADHAVGGDGLCAAENARDAAVTEAGRAAAERLSNAWHARLGALEGAIAAVPARTLPALQLKARAAARLMDEAEPVLLSLLRDLGADPAEESRA